ncbi:MAG: cytochrome c3 family protein [Gemmatimonadota bacterium]|nr:cytochrome c3 family protein [Gemmatimonadota bacterium]MDH3427658.1 cytochrome c3 family protein [Gemmatimonadota bacterium]
MTRSRQFQLTVAFLALATALAPRPAHASVFVLAQVRVTLDSTYGCVSCHSEMRRSFIAGIHSEWGMRCHDCHGGDPGAFEIPAGHRQPFLGTPTKRETVQLCASCHSDPNQMRQYGLPADQLAEFRTSRHGELLLTRGINDGPACTDCHDAHTILPPEDARSDVHPTNISATCATCHDDAEMMAPYGIPVDQFETYRQSAHGTSLYEEGNYAAPTCANCHGSHAALPAPPGEVPNVCGQCHVLVRQEFYAGPHGDATLAGELAGCLACHSQHGTEHIPSDGVQATCRECHESGGPSDAIAGALQETLVQAEQDLEAARRSIEELVLHGRDVTTARLRFRTAQANQLQLELVQHSLDSVRIEDLSRRVRSTSRGIQEMAEVSSERRWEHKLMAIPVWFLALAVVAFSAIKLSVVRRSRD